MVSSPLAASSHKRAKVAEPEIEEDDLDVEKVVQSSPELDADEMRAIGLGSVPRSIPDDDDDVDLEEESDEDDEYNLKTFFPS